MKNKINKFLTVWVCVVMVATGFFVAVNVVSENAKAGEIEIMPSKLPTPRGFTSSIWDGNDAYIFGGGTVEGPTDEIVRYNPATGDVTMMSARLPKAYWGSSAIWDGTNAYIFGGYHDYFQDYILQYNPPTDTLTVMNAKLPIPMEGAAAIWDGTYAYLFGGYGPHYSWHDEILRYDPLTDTLIVMTTKLPVPIQRACAVCDGSYAYIFGGSIPPDYPETTDQILKYDTSSDILTTMSAKLPYGRCSSSAVWDGQFSYIFGGSNGYDKYDQIVKYDPVTDTVNAISEKLPTKREGTSAIWDGQNAYIFGGYDEAGQLDDIVRFTPITRTIVQLTTDSANEIFPMWSPDGSKIAFVSDKGGSQSIWMINSDGTNLHQLPDTTYLDTNNYCSYDWVGSKIVFMRHFPGEETDIWTINDDGSNLKKVTNNPYITEICPRLSPDGTKIAFASELDNNNGWFEPYVMNFDGTGLKQIYNGYHTDSLTWAPDGTKIAVGRASDHERAHTILKINIDGTGLSSLVSNLPSSTNFAWSPDGSKITYLSGIPTNAHTPTTDRNIAIMNSDGTGQMQLFSDTSDDYFGTFDFWGQGTFVYKVWSPDSSQIVFSSRKGGSSSINTVKKDGSGLTQLFIDNGIASDATWSPSGDKIAFTSNKNGNFDIYVINLGPEAAEKIDIIIFAPHPDDEAIATSGVIHNALQNNKKVMIVYLTCGDGYIHAKDLYEQNHPIDQYDLDNNGQLNMVEFGYVRKDEATSAMTDLGLSNDNLIWLGYPDSYLYDLWTTHYNLILYAQQTTQTSLVPYPFARTPGSPYKGNSLSSDIKEVLSIYNPSEIYVPHRLDTHGDHRATNYFAIKAISELGLTCDIYTYLVHWTQKGGDWVPEKYTDEILWLVSHSLGDEYFEYGGDVAESGSSFKHGTVLSSSNLYGWTKYYLHVSPNPSSVSLGISYSDTSWLGDGPTFHAYNWGSDSWEDINGAPLPKGTNILWAKDIDSTKYVNSEGNVNIVIYADELDATDIAYVFADHSSPRDVFVPPQGLPYPNKQVRFDEISFSENSKLDIINSYTSQVDIDGSYLRAFAKNNEIFWSTYDLSQLAQEIEPVIYTVNEEGDYERCFKANSNVFINVVLRNICYYSVSGKILLSVVEKENRIPRGTVQYMDERGNRIDTNSVDVYLPPNSYKNYRFVWNSENFGNYQQSGFNFVGKKFVASLIVIGKNTYSFPYEYEFYVDQYGVPGWLRDIGCVDFGGLVGEKIKEAAKYRRDYSWSNMQATAWLNNEISEMLLRANEIGFNTVFIGAEYYNYGEMESSGEIGYWFPTGPTTDYHYSTPSVDLIEVTGSKILAREFLRNIVNKAHELGLKFIAYTDPMAIYNPIDPVLVDEPTSLAHNHAEEIGWARRDEYGGIRRAVWLESYYLPILATPQEYAVEICPSGQAKEGHLANEDIHFQEKLVEDLRNGGDSWENDPSHHYHIVKQVRWLTEYYGFDGILFDDTGRLIMAAGPADYSDDVWTKLIRPALPNDFWNAYKTCECTYCKHLREEYGVSAGRFDLDSLSNMIKHIRWQMKDVDSESVLVSSDYLVPTDVGWQSILSSEDMSNSDQFNIVKSSFARWAYKTYTGAFKPLRNDLRRSLTPGLSLPLLCKQCRPDLVRGQLIATSWANRVSPDIPSENLFNPNYDFYTKIGEYKTERLIENYIKMRNTLREEEIPVYYDMVGQDLLYHSHLRDPNNFRSSNELKVTSGEWKDFYYPFPPYKETKFIRDNPYAILYTLPCKYGERSRILHVINPRVISDIIDNNEVPRTYEFKIRIPLGQDIKNVYLISPDYNNYDITNWRQEKGSEWYESMPALHYYTDVTDLFFKGEKLWGIDGNYLTLKVPDVVTYTIAYVEFSEKIEGKGNILYTTLSPDNFVQSISQIFSPLAQQDQEITQSFEVSSSDQSLETTLSWPGSDLDLHLYTPSGQHIGYDYNTGTIETIPNSKYEFGATEESITVLAPENGTWIAKIYGKQISNEYNETGEPYILQITRKGKYLPYLSIGIGHNISTNIEERKYLSFYVANTGDGLASNVTISLRSDYFDFFPNNITLPKVKPNENISLDINSHAKKIGNGNITVTMSYYSPEGTPLKIAKGIYVEVIGAPIASLNATPREVFTYENVTFNATESIDFDGNVTEYFFEFGDGSNSSWISEPTVIHSYSDGTQMYFATVKVKDDDDHISTNYAILGIKVYNRPPIPKANYSFEFPIILENDNITFNGLDSYDLDGTIVSYDWDFGDGTTGNGEITTHTYTTAGTYTVTLTVTDDDGGIGENTTQVRVDRHSFEININPELIEIEPGESAIYTITINNTGTLDDTYNLEIYHNMSDYNVVVENYTCPWEVNLTQNTVFVPAGESVDIILNITPPSLLPLMFNTTWSFEINATCSHNASEMSNAPLSHSTYGNLTVIATMKSRIIYMMFETRDLIEILQGMDNIEPRFKERLNNTLNGVLASLAGALYLTDPDVLNEINEPLNIIIVVGPMDTPEKCLERARMGLYMFISDIEKFKGKKIGDVEANILIGKAQTIIEHIDITLGNEGMIQPVSDDNASDLLASLVIMGIFFVNNPLILLVIMIIGILSTAYPHYRDIKIDDDFEMYRKLGELSFRYGSHKTALENFKKAIWLNPNDPVTWNDMGIVLKNKGKYRPALKCYDKAIKLNSNYEKAWYNKGCALSQIGDYYRAFDCFNKVVELNVENLDAGKMRDEVLSRMLKNN